MEDEQRMERAKKKRKKRRNFVPKIQTLYTFEVSIQPVSAD